jgi:hypothetical protein
MPSALEQLAAAGVDDALFAAVMGKPDVDAWLDGQLAAGDPNRVRNDCVYWLTHYGRTFDPRLPVPDQPMVPFPKQVEYLAWLDDRIRVAKAGGNGDGLVDKCRDAGVTTFSCAKALHLWLWSPGTVVGFGSRKLELVDNKGDPNTIFEKIRYLLYRLPRWQLPRGFKRHEHDLEGKLLNPENGNAIVGEGGDNIGRGGRTTIYWVDEAAFLPHPKLVERSLSQNTRCRIDISTHNGPGTVFYEKQQSGRVSVFVFDWKDDPRKNRTETLPDGRVVHPWYEGEKKRLDPVTLAQEVDRDPTASLEGIAIPGPWVRAAVDFELPRLFLEGEVDTWAGLDIGGGTLPTSFLAVRKGPKLLPLKGYTGPNTTVIAWQVRDDAQALGVQSLALEHTGVGCLDGATRIEGVPVAERTAPAEVPVIGGRSQSSRGRCVGKADLYRVRTRSGRTVVVTLGHRFLSPGGWLPLSQLAVGSLIAADGSERAVNDWGKPTGWPGRCSRGLRLDDERLLARRVAAANKAWRRGGRVAARGGNDFYFDFARPSIGSFWTSGHDPHAAEQRQGGSAVRGLLRDTFRRAGRVIASIRLVDISQPSRPGGAQYVLARVSRDRQRCRSATGCVTPRDWTGQVHGQPGIGLGIQTSGALPFPNSPCSGTAATAPPGTRGKLAKLLRELAFCNNRNSWDEIRSITFVKYGDFYDLHVPYWEHYSAAGLWHHNTGPKGLWESAEDAQKPTFDVRALNTGSPASKDPWPDGKKGVRQVPQRPGRGLVGAAGALPQDLRVQHRPGDLRRPPS